LFFVIVKLTQSMKYVTYVWYDLEVKIVIVDGIMLVNKAIVS